MEITPSALFLINSLKENSMKKKSTKLLAFLIACSFSLSAQQIKLVDSYSQHWSGGIAGRHGVNYYFVLEFSGIKKEIIPDTIWIEGQAIPLRITENMFTQEINTQRIQKKNSVRLEIHAGTSYDDYAYRNMQPGDTAKENKPHPPSYNGVALLSYTRNGKKQYFEITKIMRTGPALNYP